MAATGTATVQLLVNWRWFTTISDHGRKDPRPVLRQVETSAKVDRTNRCPNPCGLIDRAGIRSKFREVRL